MLMRRWIVKALALVCVGVVAGHLMSCQPATDETTAVKLSLLEWNGFERPESPRVYRRLVSLSQATMANSSSC